MTRETVTIKKFVNGGFGLGHCSSGQVVLIRNSLPEETVIVTTQEAKKNYIFGKLHHIKCAHPARIEPPCQYYGNCGGCNLQHCDYPAQAMLKKEIVVDLLLRQNILGLEESAALVADTLPAPKPFGYRQRIRLQKGGNNALGFHRYRSREVVEIESCLLAKNAINEALSELRDTEESDHLLSLTKEVELLHNPESDKITCVFHYTRKPRPKDVEAAAGLCEAAQFIERIFFTGDSFPISPPISRGETADNLLSVRYRLAPDRLPLLQFTWEVGGFCQVNLEQNRAMIETVLIFTDAGKDDTVLDLYCGMGNFSVPLGQVAKEVLGIEGQGSSIRSAKRNAEFAGLGNTAFIKQPVHQACEKLLSANQCFQTVVIDPPRQGAPELAQAIGRLCDEKLVYISCDPATLCRDLKALTKEGFRILRIQPIDMFPQTHHIETVALLEKN